jgi:hypothetical protein
LKFHILAFSFLTRWGIALKNQKGNLEEKKVTPFYESLITAERALRFKKIVLNSAKRKRDLIIIKNGNQQFKQLPMFSYSMHLNMLAKAWSLRN